MLTNKTFSSFSVNDLKKAEEFYGKTLGLKVKAEEYMLHLHVTEGYEVMLYLKDDHEPATFTVLNFVVDDIDTTVDELTKKGIKFEQSMGRLKRMRKASTVMRWPPLLGLKTQPEIY